MTNKELAAALRLCGSTPDSSECRSECPFFKGTDVGQCIPKMAAACADALENHESHVMALQKEIEKLRAQLEMARKPQWVSVEERLPVAPPDYVDEAGKTWFSVSDRFLAVVGAGSRVCEVSYTYPNREFTYRGKPITVSYWANLPEPPSTEGVE